MNASLRLGVVVGEQDPWRFFYDVYQNLKAHYRVDLFHVRRVQWPIFYFRLNGLLLHHDLETFLKNHDVVFFEWASELLVLATHLPKTCRIVVRLHRYEMFQWASKVKWDSVDQVILVSRAMQRQFVSRFPEHGYKTVVIPVGISTEKYRIDLSKQSGGNIGTLCSLTPRKRVYELILAFYGLSQKQANVHLHIGGNSVPEHADYFDAMQRLVVKLNLRDKVTFYGEIETPWLWYRTIDIFVSNSYSEGLQVALMEAMASGCYCLSHYWDGVEELLPEEYLFFTHAELEEKILRYLQASPASQNHQREKLHRIACEKVDERFIQAQIRNIIERV